MHQTVLRDVVLLLVMGFVFMVVAMLPHLNPPEAGKDADPPGNLIVNIIWPEGNTDVDLWVYGPGELRPVGYSNKSGILWNLLRDDLGDRVDASGLNFENAYTRGLVPGRYTLNVHCYRCPQVPVPVEAEISVKSEVQANTIKMLFTTSVTLFSSGQEETLASFELDEKGRLVGRPDSILRPLRNGFETGDD